MGTNLNEMRLQASVVYKCLLLQKPCVCMCEKVEVLIESVLVVIFVVVIVVAVVSLLLPLHALRG